MHEIKEEIRESIRLQKEIEFLENFEHGDPDDFVTRGEMVKVLTIMAKALQNKIGA